MWHMVGRSPCEEYKLDISEDALQHNTITYSIIARKEPCVKLLALNYVKTVRESIFTSK